jgi:peptidoglycan-associated lipoprotein
MKQNILNILAFAIVLLSVSCTLHTSKKAATKPRNWAREMLKWDQDFVEYGNVKKGESHDHIYKFTNISKENVEISMCTACSCTTLDWTTKIVKPGESGEINTHFDSTEKDKSETIGITIILKNTDPIMSRPIIDEVKFHFDLVK